jgi:hypothetical protein
VGRVVSDTRTRSRAGHVARLAQNNHENSSERARLGGATRTRATCSTRFPTPARRAVINRPPPTPTPRPHFLLHSSLPQSAHAPPGFALRRCHAQPARSERPCDRPLARLYRASEPLMGDRNCGQYSGRAPKTRPFLVRSAYYLPLLFNSCNELTWLDRRGNKASLITRIHEHDQQQTSGEANPSPASPAPGQTRNASTVSAPSTSSSASSPPPPAATSKPKLPAETPKAAASPATPAPASTSVSSSLSFDEILDVKLPDLTIQPPERPVQIVRHTPRR